jgi:hypothetical protein
MSELTDSILGLLFILWYFICLKLISKYTGWASLACKYTFKGRFNGKILRCQSPGGGIHIGANESGLYLAMLFVFRPFHSPLFVPWQDIKAMRTKRLWTKGYMLVFPSVPQARSECFFFADRTFKKLAKHNSGRLMTVLKDGVLGTEDN